MIPQDKGIIALDIDGTITADPEEIPQKVKTYLGQLVEEGWKLVFITGRSFSFAYPLLETLSFPTYLALQNGADILMLPEKKILMRHYLPCSLISHLDKVYEGRKEDYLIYSGYERGDFCYYRPLKFSKEMLLYLEKLKTFSNELWIEMERFDFQEEIQFPLIKCLGTFEEMREIHQKLQELISIQVSLIRDPINKELFLNLITATKATKGEALDFILNHIGSTGTIIAAGDDLNDISMLKRAQVKIVMETAPREVLALADIIALNASEFGIIEALKKATARSY